MAKDPGFAIILLREVFPPNSVLNRKLYDENFFPAARPARRQG